LLPVGTLYNEKPVPIPRKEIKTKQAQKPDHGLVSEREREDIAEQQELDRDVYVTVEQ